MMLPRKAPAPRELNRRRVRALLIEPQRIFVPALWDILERGGLEVKHAIPEPDLRSLVEVQPQFIFFDIDFIYGEPMQIIQMIRMSLPLAAICLYTSTERPLRWHAAWCRAVGQTTGITGIISKSAPEEEMLEALGTLIRNGTYADWRTIPWIRDAGWDPSLPR